MNREPRYCGSTATECMEDWIAEALRIWYEQPAQPRAIRNRRYSEALANAVGWASR